jgi:hypothetical protein
MCLSRLGKSILKANCEEDRRQNGEVDEINAEVDKSKDTTISFK